MVESKENTQVSAATDATQEVGKEEEKKELTAEELAD